MIYYIVPIIFSNTELERLYLTMKQKKD